MPISVYMVFAFYVPISVHMGPDLKGVPMILSVLSTSQFFQAHNSSKEGSILVSNQLLHQIDMLGNVILNNKMKQYEIRGLIFLNYGICL